MWLQNGSKSFDLWATYFGNSPQDPEWRDKCDTFRRRKGGKFENFAALMREPGVAEVLTGYDGVNQCRNLQLLPLG